MSCVATAKFSVFRACERLPHAFFILEDGYMDYDFKSMNVDELQELLRAEILDSDTDIPVNVELVKAVCAELDTRPEAQLELEVDVDSAWHRFKEYAADNVCIFELDDRI